MTKKPMSTISFNTEPFLRDRLTTLVDDGLLQSWLYIRHFAEKDTTKDHYHLLLIPCRPVDPMSIRKKFVEPCYGNLDLGCLPFQSSKISDWLLYAIHYPPYLLKKGLERVNTYNIEDICTNESYLYIHDIFNNATEELTDTRLTTFLDRMRNGASFGEILASGLVPPNQVVFFDKLYKLNSHIIGEKLDSNGNEQIPF